MDWFKVLVAGKNFKIMAKSGGRMVGFFATGLVSANSPDEAQKLAVEKAGCDLRGIQPDVSEEPLSQVLPVRVESLGAQVGSGDNSTRFTFYLQED